MNAIKRTIAVTQLLLIFPSALFMTALLLRDLQPLQFEPAHTAQQIVMWYSARLWTLWVLLIALPVVVVVTGCATVFRNWNNDVGLRKAARQMLAAPRAHLATLIVAALTLAAGGVLAVVAVHMAAN
jgi:hypothetical protein